MLNKQQAVSDVDDDLEGNCDCWFVNRRRKAPPTLTYCLTVNRPVVNDQAANHRNSSSVNVTGTFFAYC